MYFRGVNKNSGNSKVLPPKAKGTRTPTFGSLQNFQESHVTFALVPTILQLSIF